MATLNAPRGRRRRRSTKMVEDGSMRLWLRLSVLLLTLRETSALLGLSLAPFPGMITFPPLPTQTPPTPPPSKRPTEQPSPAPTEATVIETDPPSPSPTKEPEPEPTPMPTPEPTPEPTLEPTPEPTLEPTPEPTPEPSSAPTSEPTTEPTLEPTVEPTIEPSSSPSTQPSAEPTLAPITSPTLEPTNEPSIAPTEEPTTADTEEPTFADTETPTKLPTSQPSISPSTAVPTTSPSSAPSWPGTQPPSRSLYPTDSPSDVPSSMPSVNPSLLPTTMPSSFPSGIPSQEPSSAPTLTMQKQDLNVVMFLVNSAKLNDISIITWESVTENHIRLELESDDSLDLKDVGVGINFINQEVRVAEPPTRRRWLIRSLQQQDTSSPLRIEFFAALEYRSEDRDLDVSDLIGSTFNTEEDRNRYLERLERSGNAALRNIDEVRVEIDGIPQVVDSNLSSDDGGGGIPIVVIAGAAAGAAALALVVGGLLVLRRRSRLKENGTLPYSKSPSARFTNEIVVEGQDDISTLGDPMYAPGGMLIPGLEKDETVVASIVSGDYDYARTYGAAGKTPLSVDGSKKLLGTTAGSTSEPGSSGDMSKLGLGQDSLFSDESSFEEQFMDPEDQIEIIAPAGKLGMVIDTPGGGIPVVHAIKETSPLADQVRVGDRLLSVDDEDTTGMTALQVSKLISTKADNPSRVLLFVRTRARAGSTDR